MRLCFVGDSFVNGTGDPAYLGWTGRLCVAAAQRGFEVTAYNLGIRRDTSDDIARRWHDEVSRRLPLAHPEYDARLVFSLGVNDTTRTGDAGEATRVPVAHSLGNLRHIVLAARPHYPLLFVGPPPVADQDHNMRIGRLSQQFASVCQELSVPYLDVCVPLLASEIWMREVATGDGSHPGAAGYAELARLVEAWPAWTAWFL